MSDVSKEFAESQARLLKRLSHCDGCGKRPNRLAPICKACEPKVLRGQLAEVGEFLQELAGGDPVGTSPWIRHRAKRLLATIGEKS